MTEMNSCEALKIIDGIDMVEKLLEEKRSVARKKFRAIDDDSELERRILIYERMKHENIKSDFFRRGRSCYVCGLEYKSLGNQYIYDICDDCLDVWDEESLYQQK